MYDYVIIHYRGWIAIGFLIYKKYIICIPSIQNIAVYIVQDINY